MTKETFLIIIESAENFLFYTGKKMEEERKQPIEHIENLAPFISEVKQEEIKDLLTYWEEMKVEGERLKEEFRKSHSREDFLKLLMTMAWQTQLLLVEWVENVI